MDNKDLKKKLKDLKPILEKNYKVKSIGLFGSFARNEANENSDVDILVQFSEDIGWEFIDLKRFLEESLERDVDLVTVSFKIRIKRRDIKRCDIPMRRDLLFLKDIIKAMNKIFSYTEKMTKEDFKKDDKTIDAVLRNIEIIGEAANKLSEKIYEENKNVPWGRMIGLRNIVIHEYFGVDLNIIWQIVTVNLPETKPKIEEILKKCHNLIF